MKLLYRHYKLTTERNWHSQGSGPLGSGPIYWSWVWLFRYAFCGHWLVKTCKKSVKTGTVASGIISEVAESLVLAEHDIACRSFVALFHLFEC